MGSSKLLFAEWQTTLLRGLSATSAIMLSIMGCFLSVLFAQSSWGADGRIVGPVDRLLPAKSCGLLLRTPDGRLYFDPFVSEPSSAGTAEGYS
jgi:hypothetical protein